MRTLLLGVFCSLLFVACNQSKKEEPMTETENILGGDVDDHGCIGSAGYVWSELKGECIRVWEDGITLLPLELDESKAVHAAFVLFSNDRSQLELFMPTEKKSILLEKASEHIYEKGIYTYDTEVSVLYINAEAAYKEDKE